MTTPDQAMSEKRRGGQAVGGTMIDLTPIKARIEAAKPTAEAAKDVTAESLLVIQQCFPLSYVLISYAEAQALVEELETLRVAPQQERTG